MGSKLVPCPGCGDSDAKNFGQDRHRPDGLTTYCKQCRHDRYIHDRGPLPPRVPKPRKPKSQARLNAANRAWRKRNPQHSTPYMQEYRENNRDAYNAYHRAYVPPPPTDAPQTN